ncbi:MAG: 50S ribosomal protein L19e [Nanoarchaeota archaeon]
MQLKLQKKLAGVILKSSPKRIKLDTTRLDDIKKAIRKIDIRALIDERAITKKPKKGISRGRAKHLAKQVSKGRRRGMGSRKGKANARFPEKLKWIYRIRAQREILKYLRDKKLLSTKVYRELYYKAKGGFFRSRRHLMLYITEHNLKS